MSAHKKAIAGVAAHPTKPIAVTASDDHTWHMWHLPSGERILSGEGHAGWVAGAQFHPKVRRLAATRWGPSQASRLTSGFNGTPQM